MSRPELQLDDALYRAMFDVGNAVKLLICPVDGRILDANAAAVEFYGWPRDRLRAMRITDINTLSPDEVKAEMENARTLRRKYFRFRHRTASGEIRAVEVHSAPVRVGDHELLFSIIHDVTERDQLETHLRRAARLETIGRLAGGVAHDFNNLLTVVLSAARLARGRLEPDHAARRYLDEIDGAAGRGAALTRQLLTFSRRQVLAPRPLAVADVVEPLVPLLARSLGSAHALDLRITPELPTVMADPAQLEQVVMNLVLNARDAMPSGGEIRIEVGASGGDDAALIPPGRWVTLAVADDGVGMDEATRSRVFEPFFTTKPDGTGMGLATVYGIVVQSGGHLAVDTAPGRGSTFTAYLPAADAPPARIAPPRPPAAPARPRATILLVDDLAPLRATVAALLRELGHDVVEAASYDEAVAAAGRLDALDLVITDVVMPGRSGVDLVRELRAHRPAVRCIVMSGDLRTNALGDLGATVVCLPKPFSLEALEAAVDEALAPQS